MQWAIVYGETDRQSSSALLDDDSSTAPLYLSLVFGGFAVKPLIFKILFMNVPERSISISLRSSKFFETETTAPLRNRLHDSGSSSSFRFPLLRPFSCDSVDRENSRTGRWTGRSVCDYAASAGMFKIQLRSINRDRPRESAPPRRPVGRSSLSDANSGLPILRQSWTQSSDRHCSPHWICISLPRTMSDKPTTDGPPLHDYDYGVVRCSSDGLNTLT